MGSDSMIFIFFYCCVLTAFPFSSWRRQWQLTPILLPGKSHGWRSLVGCSPWGRKELDMTEQLHFTLSLSCIGEGNGNPLQYSCLENPRDGGAWWAAVYGVAQGRTWLKRLSSSSTLLFHIHQEALFSSFLLSAIRVVSSVYPSLLIFLLANFDIQSSISHDVLCI